MAEAGTHGLMGDTPLRVVFMGTPEFAAESLRALAAWDGCEVVAVYTQPDRPCGRGRQCRPSAVKAVALEHGYEVRQPEHFKDDAEAAALAALRPDVLVVAAYGLILPQAVLDAARLMPVNVHASLLPRWRGAAPIQRAIQAGDVVTGITIMRMVAELDAGPILTQRALRIGHDEHAGQVHDQLAEMGGECLVEALARMREGRLAQFPQDEAKATYAAKLTKAEGEIDWDRPAQQVHDHIRAMHPWPGAFYHWNGSGSPMRLAVAPGSVSEQECADARPGDVVGEVDGRLGIAAADVLYLTDAVTPEGKKPQSPREFACGYLVRCEGD